MTDIQKLNVAVFKFKGQSIKHLELTEDLNLLDKLGVADIDLFS